MFAAIEAAPTKNERPSGGKRYWPQIATSVFVPVLLLGVIEGALRLFGVGFSTDLTVPCTVQGHAAACYNLFFPAPFFPPGMIKTPQAYAIPAEKPQGTFRIFVLGESAAMGDPDPAYAFSRYLEVMLRERYPSMKFEVVNTGSVAINSHVLLPIAEGLSKQRPDVEKAVVDFGRIVHGAELGAAHGAEGGFFVVVVGEGFVVHGAGGFGVEGEGELLFPVEFVAGIAEGVVAVAGAGASAGDVGGVGGNFVGDDAVFHVFLVG